MGGTVLLSLIRGVVNGRDYCTSLDVPVTPHVYSRLYHVIGCPWSRDESLNQLAPQLKRAGDATGHICVTVAYQIQTEN